MKSKIKIFMIFIIVILLIVVSYLYLNINKEEKEHASIPEKDRVLTKDGCEVGGCNGEICTEKVESLASACLWRDEYYCYSKTYTTCEKQTDGKCRWTDTTEFKECLDRYSED